MTENNDAQKPKDGSTLADRLFSEGFKESAIKHLKQAEQDFARGATEQANEHFKRAMTSGAVALTNITSPNLTDEENQVWLNLQHRKYIVDESGIINSRILDKRSEDLFWRLEKKASGQDKGE